MLDCKTYKTSLHQFLRPYSQSLNSDDLTRSIPRLYRWRHITTSTRSILLHKMHYCVVLTLT